MGRWDCSPPQPRVSEAIRILPALFTYCPTLADPGQRRFRSNGFRPRLARRFLVVSCPAKSLETNDKRRASFHLLVAFKYLQRAPSPSSKVLLILFEASPPPSTDLIPCLVAISLLSLFSIASIAINCITSNLFPRSRLLPPRFCTLRTVTHLPIHTWGHEALLLSTRTYGVDRCYRHARSIK